MKKLLALLGTLVVLGALIVCFGCNKQEPVAQQPTIIRQDAETAKMAQAKTDALQEFQRFRLASTYRDGERYQISLLLALGRANLKPEDINTSGAELSAHVWDLWHKVHFRRLF